MIQQLRIKNFRSFSDREFFFWEKNFISGENGSGKSNTLEALSLFSEPLLDMDYALLLKKWEQVLYIEILLRDGKKISISYDGILKKKKYSINSKATTKKKVRELVPWAVSFHPLEMNMMYLWPTKRREFLDSILAASFSDYGNILKKYKKVLTSRNRVLKNISEGKSKKSELDFWDHHFVELACSIYKYRKILIDFFSDGIESILPYFSKKVETVGFKYISKVDMQFPKETIQQYLSKNRDRDILLRKTAIGPHVDDFDVLLDGSSLSTFASRWEVKSTIIGLKFLESQFREIQTMQKSIFLIDDLLSELDETHKDMIFKNMSDCQVFITSIVELDYIGDKIRL